MSRRLDTAAAEKLLQKPRLVGAFQRKTSDQVVQVRTRDIEALRRGLDVPFVLDQALFDQATLKLLGRGLQGGGSVARFGLGKAVPGFNYGASFGMGSNHPTMDDIFELPDIARPARSGERTQRARTQSQAYQTVPFRVALTKMMRQD